MTYTEVNVEYHGVKLLLKGDFDKAEPASDLQPGCEAEYFLMSVLHCDEDITPLFGSKQRSDLEDLAVRKLED